MSSVRFLASLLGGTPAAATAITLTGPSSGTVGVASTNFTVGANGTITGTITVTPNDGADGGTFTPTTVAISSGTPTATFTYTPANVGAPTATVNVTNDGGLSNPTGIAYTATAASTPIAFSGTIPTLNGTEGSAFSQNLSSYFSGTETPFAYTVQSGTLPAGLTLNSSTGVISGTPTTAGTSSGIVIRGTDATPDTADSNSFSIVIATPPAGTDIRLVPGLYFERGGYAASLSGLRWVAFTDTTLGAIEASGSSLTTNSSGQPTIDIAASSFAVGDFVPLLITSYDTGTAAADREVLTFFGFVEAVAQA